MKKTKVLKTKLKELLDQKRFGQLEEYRDSKIWDEMSAEEKELLSILFIQSGEQNLHEKRKQAFENFKIATKICPNNPKIFYRKALALASHEDNPNCMRQASKALKKATSLDSTFFDAWHVWGNILVQLGTFTQESKHLNEAHHKFEEAEKLIQRQNSDRNANLYRHWGICWYVLGKISGEPYDFRQAIEKYSKASEYGMEGAEFWNEKSNALVALACLISKQEFFFEAIELYWKAVKHSPNYSEGWLNLAYSFQALYDIKGQEVYFNLANESFEQTARLDSDNVSLWLRWGTLLLSHGKKQGNPKSFLESFGKFEAADFCEANHPTIQSCWGEAMMHYGVLTDQLSYLREAECKIVASLELQPDNHVLWFLYGNCLLELGRYFHDEDYFVRAIQQFQFCLSQKRQDPLLWYGVASAYFAIGELRNDHELVEKSARLFTRVIEFGGHENPKIWNDWGVSFMKLAEMTNEKQFVKAAAEKFEQAIILETESGEGAKLDPEWFYNYGCAMDLLGDLDENPECYEKAIQSLSKALQIDPKYTLVHFNLALALSHLGEVTTDVEYFNKSFEHFQIRINSDPEDDCAWNEWGVTMINLAQLVNDPAHTNYSKTLYEQAEQKLICAVALGNVQAYYNLACLYSLTGNFADALHNLERAEIYGSLPLIDDLLHDDWLESIRRTPAFKSFISHLFPKGE